MASGDPPDPGHRAGVLSSSVRPIGWNATAARDRFIGTRILRPRWAARRYNAGCGGGLTTLLTRSNTITPDAFVIDQGVDVEAWRGHAWKSCSLKRVGQGVERGKIDPRTAGA